MRCYVITKSKKVRVINLRESRPYLIYNEGVYKLDGRKVNLSYKEGKINPTPELIYFENTPIAYNPTTKIIDESSLIRDTFLKNFFESTAESGSKIGGMFSFLGDHKKLFVGIGIVGVLLIIFFAAGGYKGI